MWNDSSAANVEMNNDDNNKNEPFTCTSVSRGVCIVVRLDFSEHSWLFDKKLVWIIHGDKKQNLHPLHKVTGFTYSPFTLHFRLLLHIYLYIIYFLVYSIPQLNSWRMHFISRKTLKIWMPLILPEMYSNSATKPHTLWFSQDLFIHKTSRFLACFISEEFRDTRTYTQNSGTGRGCTTSFYIRAGCQRWWMFQMLLHPLKLIKNVLTTRNPQVTTYRTHTHLLSLSLSLYFTSLCSSTYKCKSKVSLY